MLCPYCKLGISLDTRKEDIQPLENGKGIEVVQGFCPMCNNFIVLIKEGSCIWIDEDCELSGNEVIKKIIFPQFHLRITNIEVPKKYRDELNEAYSIMFVSLKASAAMSRRLLQVLLREEFKIKVKSDNLSDEIIEFQNLPGPSTMLKREVDAIRKIGNFAAHPRKSQVTGEIIEVEPDEAEWSVEVLFNILEHLFILPEKANIRMQNLNQKSMN